LVTFSAEYVEYASELGTQIARVTKATIAERINTFSFVMSLSPRFGGRASTSLTLIQQRGDVPPGPQIPDASRVPGALLRLGAARPGMCRSTNRTALFPARLSHFPHGFSDLA
jgi:hypothetical protein